MLRHGLSIVPVVLAAIALTAPPASAQLPSNATLQGAYNFRYLGADTGSNDKAFSFQGTLTFDGKANSNGVGTFTVAGQGAGASPDRPATMSIRCFRTACST